ncbi:YARHG domain-containing protein [Leptospira dzoumogneensis]|uniref:YARHG domain-containing protein n=1 Tax=Leptospira dzoumogneensis TaxID=2484904 RepID=A0A4Z1AUL4_9LEPT|nr:YARHG domain-containing protein [Leptospira dzoumogneensis]TGN00016.1 YARHG domain-containing protein [Leptospira dzoumogneensis]
MIRLFISIVAFISTISCSQENEKFDSIFKLILSDKVISESDLSSYTKSSDLRIIRNSIFAKHGYIFKSDELKDFFAKKSWYKVRFHNVDNLLSQNDKRNIELISYKESNSEIQEFIAVDADVKPSQKDEMYFGFWHDSPVVASGWGDTLSLFPNGKIITRFNTMDCAKRVMAYAGSWVIEKNILIIRYSLKQHIEGGEFETASGSCGSDKELVNGQVKVLKLSPSMKVEYKVSSVSIDNNDYSLQGLPVISVEDARYWKLNDNPNYY